MEKCGKLRPCAGEVHAGCYPPALSAGVTGEIHFVDSGYNITAMPHPEALKGQAAAEEQAEQAQGVAAE